MGLYNTSSSTVSTASTATPTSVASATSSETILAANSNRKGATILNNSTANLFIDFNSVASLTAYTVKINAGGYYEVPYNYTGIISGIWDAANGSALVRELTP